MVVSIKGNKNTMYAINKVGFYFCTIELEKRIYGTMKVMFKTFA